MATSEKDLIQSSLEEFSRKFRKSVPLRHFSEHRDEAKIREMAQQESDKVLNKFMRKIKPRISIRRKLDFANELCSGIEKLIDEYVTENQDCKSELETFSLRRTEEIYEHFRASLEAKLLLNPVMDLKMVEEFFESGKFSALAYFERMWKHGNVDVFEKQKRILEEKLDDLKKEELQKQSQRLEGKAEENARKSIQKVKKIILEMCRQIRNDLIAVEKTPKQILREGVLGIHDYLIGKGNILIERHGNLHSELKGILINAIRSLDKVVGDMSMEDASGWTDCLDEKLKSTICKYDVGATQMQQEGNRLVNLEVDEPVPPIVDDSKEMEDSTAMTSGQHGNRIVGMKAGAPGSSWEKQGNETNRVEESGTGIMATTEPKESIMLEPPHNIYDVDDKDQTEISETETKSHQQSVPAKRTEIKNQEATMAIKVGVKRACRQNEKTPNATVAPPSSKRSKWFVSSASNGDLNVQNDDGLVPLLLAISEGQDLAIIKQMLDQGANVNVRTNNKCNAAHIMIWALIHKRLTNGEALAILNLLVAKGFKLINEGTTIGRVTPLLYAMEYTELSEELLDWFFKNRADFTITDECRNSILFKAIINRQSIGIVRNIFDRVWVGNPKHVNRWRCNALHVAVRSAHDAALELFIDRTNVNEECIHKLTPLHLLFMDDNLDYQHCLKRLLRKGANFGAQCSFNGYIPLVMWIKYARRNPFPTLLEMKDSLPITPEIASATLTAIVEAIARLTSSRNVQSDLSQFITFLINDKSAKIRIGSQCGGKWGDWENWKKAEEMILNSNFMEELRTSGHSTLKGNLLEIKPGSVGEFYGRTHCGYFIVRIEVVLVCLLACKMYQGFVGICRSLLYCRSSLQGWGDRDRYDSDDGEPVAYPPEKWFKTPLNLTF